MDDTLATLFETHDRVLTAAQVCSVVSRGTMRGLARRKAIVAVYRGVYTIPPVSLEAKLTALGRLYGEPVAACKGTAAALYGFDTEGTSAVHIVDPGGRHVHGIRGVFVHQLVDAPVRGIGGQSATTPAWTAVDCARGLARPRALATLDAALATGLCTVDEVRAATVAHAGRRGIIKVRKLVELADGRAQSAMESETRLVILDSALPRPDLQVPVLDDAGLERFYLDLAWEDAKLAVEYDGDDFHSTPLEVRRDKARIAWLQERGWMVVVVTADDVRRSPERLIARLDRYLRERRVA